MPRTTPLHTGERAVLALLLLGQRRAFLAGVGLFVAGSLAGGLAGSSGVLVAGRVVQGLGVAPSEGERWARWGPFGIAVAGSPASTKTAAATRKRRDSTMSAPGTPSFPAAAERRAPSAPWWPAARVLGALATLAVGAVHVRQYYKLHSEVPTIGTLFALNFIGATAIGLALLTPIEHLAGRYGGLVVTLLALAGGGQSATSFVFLWIAERTPLFGLQEPGHDPEAFAASRISEVAAVVLLGAFLIGRTADHRRSSS